MKVEGLNKILTNLKELPLAQGAVGKGVERGLKKSGLMIFRDAQKEVPVDTGNLKGSGFTRKLEGAGITTKVGVGYTASYGIKVHEDLSVTHGRAYNRKHADDIAAGLLSSRGENQKAKFLEDPAKRLRGDVLRTISKEVQKELNS